MQILRKMSTMFNGQLKKKKSLGRFCAMKMYPKPVMLKWYYLEHSWTYIENELLDRTLDDYVVNSQRPIA